MLQQLNELVAKDQIFCLAQKAFQPQKITHTGQNPSLVQESEYLLNLVNTSDETQHHTQVLIASFTLPLASPMYLEGYQMLSQTAGTVGEPQPIGRINEACDYRLYKSDLTATYGANLLTVKIANMWYLIGATSSFHSSIIFQIKDGICQVFWDLENITIDAHGNYGCDYLAILADADRAKVMARYAELINTHHTPCAFSRKTGWCSWYAYYANLAESDIMDNLQIMTQDYPELEYVQIDDGYQSHMGDWLIDSDKFQNGLAKLCADIIAHGKKPAIWVAPFIASGDSLLFKQHPNWFVKAQHDPQTLVKAEDLTYGGWRDTPWYLLDMTVHEVRDYLTRVFKTFRSYGIDYFKLDACYWGAIKGGKYASGDISAVTHYRLGLETIRSAVGNDAYILGCNAPLWPSLGLVNAQRIGDDIERSVPRINQIVNEARYRNWMSGRLWINDIDCLVTKALQPQDQELADRYYRLLMALAITTASPVLLGD